MLHEPIIVTNSSVSPAVSLAPSCGLPMLPDRGAKPEDACDSPASVLLAPGLQSTTELGATARPTTPIVVPASASRPASFNAAPGAQQAAWGQANLPPLARSHSPPLVTLQRPSSGSRGSGPIFPPWASTSGNYSRLAAPARYYAMFSGPSGDGVVPLLGSFASHQGFGGTLDLMYANRQVRHAFLRKVLALASLHLLAAAALGATLATSPSVQRSLKHAPWLLAVALGAAAVLLLLLTCCEPARRQRPANVAALLAVTAVQGVVVGVATIVYSTRAGLLAQAISAAVAAAMAAAALQSDVEVTAFTGTFVAAAVSLLAVLLTTRVLHMPTVDMLMAGCSALLFSSYMLYDVQLVSAGEHHAQVRADEYVLAVLCIYVDVINVLLYIMWLVIGKDDD